MERPASEAASPRARTATAAMTCTAALLCASCSQILVQGDAAVDTKRIIPGFTVVRVEPASTAAVVIRSQTVGLNANSNRFSVGYDKEIRVLIPDPSKCQVVVLIDSNTKVNPQSLNEISNNICIVGEELP
ncbi:MAG: hypothetical protein IT566_17125 [Rhodospirillaceae bacterium]|nr:hypothetical protein [Rhodospirillaceae bacterium]